MNKILYTATLCALMSLCTACHNKEERIPVTVQRLSEISELGTVEYTISKVVKANNNDNLLVLFGSKKIIFTTTCHLKAGFDLSKLQEGDILCRGSHVKVTLPKPELLSLDMRPEEIHLIYSESTGLRSSFTPEERNALLAQGEKEIRKSVPTMGILKDAETNGKAFLEQLLSQWGYKDIEVTCE